VIVIDNSLVAKWFFPEEDSPLALSLLRHVTSSNEALIAPNLLHFEFINVIRKKTRSGHVTPGEAREAASQMFALPIRLLPGDSFASNGLHFRALEIANEHDLPATYDAHYVALAEMYGCDLRTADRRLIRQLSGRLPYVRALEDYRSDSA
jgi:predicted nucleic acid-binding protein